MPDLIARIRAALEDKTAPLWFPDLTDDLAETGWLKLRESIGLTPLDYGTVRVLSGNPGAARNIVKHQPAPFKAIPIELMTIDFIRQYEKRGIRFYSAEEISKSEALFCIEDAISILNQLPTLSTTVATLVRALHILKPETCDHDMSFSEPHIPFSIFISVPKIRIHTDALRVAESIVHETMHLQLTLIEQYVPLIISTSQQYYSPWRKEYRDAQGILHALYVFRVIDRVLEQLVSIVSSTNDVTEYIHDRRYEIDKQISKIRSFQHSPELTSIGTCLLQRLI